MEKNYVQIQSNKTIQVTSGLQFSDYTDVESPLANRKNVKPRWTKGTCLIKTGQHWYPAEIAKWSTVKSLEKSGILTIGKFSETCDDENVVKESTKLKRNLKDIKEKETDEVKEPGRGKRLQEIAN